MWPKRHRRIRAIDRFLAGTGADIRERWSPNSPRTCATYSHKTDRISVPYLDYYKRRADFYSTLFHELGHWTAHPSRCGREPGWRVNQLNIDYEEMIAEFVATHLCRWFNIKVSANQTHSDYIARHIISFKRHGIKPADKVILEAEEEALHAVHYLLSLGDNESYWRRSKTIRSIFGRGELLIGLAPPKARRKGLHHDDKQTDRLLRHPIVNRNGPRWPGQSGEEVRDTRLKF